MKTEKIAEMVEAAIAKNGLEKTISVNKKMMADLSKYASCPEKIFQYDEKVNMVLFVFEYLSKKQ